MLPPYPNLCILHASLCRLELTCDALLRSLLTPCTDLDAPRHPCRGPGSLRKACAAVEKLGQKLPLGHMAFPLPHVMYRLLLIAGGRWVSSQDDEEATEPSPEDCDMIARWSRGAGGVGWVGWCRHQLHQSTRSAFWGRQSLNDRQARYIWLHAGTHRPLPAPKPAAALWLFDHGLQAALDRQSAPSTADQAGCAPDAAPFNHRRSVLVGIWAVVICQSTLSCIVGC